ncbi:phosphoglucomutase [Trichococcus patagoniensis]|uniref:phosphoglucomutase (alpha-D-glucose-1,6-bisphosphate-dependent) n=1 Tax=Trichococcus patagoniensis TaxID=382641 RepID=A0A2T5IQ57_9LACT|nr:phospho-sugar mutase [Trichococcus patagoniensis]PTQ85946.1 phosphoglucomutase [Trichococcus patagoniensis]
MYKERVAEWLAFDEDTKTELLAISDEKELEDRFYKNVSFGTGGLRGLMGAGTNRMNSYTVKKASMGLANYVLSHSAGEASIAIAYDTRNHSQQFAEDAAAVFSSMGIKAYLFDVTIPTPVLSFAVRHLGCDAGIVLTASHNPKEYNGYKVYDNQGGQLTPDAAREVTSFIESIENFDSVKELTGNPDLIEMIGEAVLDVFITEIRKQSIHQGHLHVVYTPLHGAGNIPVRRALEGFKVSIVKEQELPDGNFSTVRSPNPEDRKALELAIAQAKQEDADIVIGTDPDCDRIGVGVKHEGQYRLLTGNQIGALLADFVIAHTEVTEDSTLIKTIVTNDFGAKIASGKGLKIIETLTGFKYIGEKINEFETSDDLTNEFVLGYEESYGYLVGTHARDKDAVVSALLICEMAAYYKAKGLTLFDKLEQLYGEHGYYLDALDSVTLTGVEGAARIKEMMEEVRESDADFFANVDEVRDYATGIADLPKENVIKFMLKDESWVAIRPSGTEPKIKFYYSVRADDEQLAQEKLQVIKTQIQQNLDIAL